MRSGRLAGAVIPGKRRLFCFRFFLSLGFLTILLQQQAADVYTQIMFDGYRITDT